MVVPKEIDPQQVQCARSEPANESWVTDDIKTAYEDGKFMCMTNTLGVYGLITNKDSFGKNRKE